MLKQLEFEKEERFEEKEEWNRNGCCCCCCCCFLAFEESSRECLKKKLVVHAHEPRNECLNVIDRLCSEVDAMLLIGEEREKFN